MADDWKKNPLQIVCEHEGVYPVKNPKNPQFFNKEPGHQVLGLILLREFRLPAASEQTEKWCCFWVC